MCESTCEVMRVRIQYFLCRGVCVCVCMDMYYRVPCNTYLYTAGRMTMSEKDLAISCYTLYYTCGIFKLDNGNLRSFVLPPIPPGGAVGVFRHNDICTWVYLQDIILSWSLRNNISEKFQCGCIDIQLRDDHNNDVSYIYTPSLFILWFRFDFAK